MPLSTVLSDTPLLIRQTPVIGALPMCADESAGVVRAVFVLRAGVSRGRTMVGNGDSATRL